MVYVDFLLFLSPSSISQTTLITTYVSLTSFDFYSSIVEVSLWYVLINRLGLVLYWYNPLTPLSPNLSTCTLLFHLLLFFSYLLILTFDCLYFFIINHCDNTYVLLVDFCYFYQRKLHFYYLYPLTHETEREIVYNILRNLGIQGTNFDKIFFHLFL